MKLQRYGLLLAVVTLVFVSFTAGFFIGRARDNSPVTITTQHVSPKPSQTLASSGGGGGEKHTEGIGLVNINTADVKELAALPGIGETLAERIVEYRNRNGAFMSIYDITAVSGIGDAKLEAMKEYITVGESESYDENTDS